MLSESIAENGEVRSTAECHACGGIYAITISRITSSSS
jgi:hypothetical protein